ncbi:MAG: hypothetical protein ACE5Q3_02210 [Alphaproteobacteria bacterium]
MRLHAGKLGLAFGIVYALAFFLYGLAATLFGWGIELVGFIGDFYLGFGPTIGGAVIGAIWGLVVGFVFFGLAGVIYNALVGSSGER